jgi:dimethylaniline monooxygenase (N-oxide forming)
MINSHGFSLGSLRELVQPSINLSEKFEVNAITPEEVNNHVLFQLYQTSNSDAAIANKSNKAQLYISAPYRPKVPSTIEKLRASLISVPYPNLKGRKIDVAPWPDYIDEKGIVHFHDNGRLEYHVMKHVSCKPDIVVYATGYTQVFSFLDKDYPTIFDADIRRIWKTGVEDVGFIGFVRPSFGMPTTH